MNKRLSRAQLTAALEAEMAQTAINQAKHGTGNPLPPGTPGDFDTSTSLIRLKIVDVDEYEDNPRTEENPLFLEIKESIRARGLDQKLVVTKRPGTSKYILARGGKTRLKALKELAAEEPARFTWMDFDLVHYKSESDLLVGHIVENGKRAAMSFYDTAKAYLQLRDKRSKELKREISSKDFSEELKQLGLGIDRRELGDYEFLHGQLGPLGNMAKTIVQFHVKNDLRPQFQILKSISEVIQSGTDFKSLYRGWLADYASTVESADTLDIANLVAYIHAQAAKALDLDEHDLDIAKDALAANSKLDAPALKEAIQATKLAQAVQIATTLPQTSPLPNGSDFGEPGGSTSPFSDDGKESGSGGPEGAGNDDSKPGRLVNPGRASGMIPPELEKYIKIPGEGDNTGSSDTSAPAHQGRSQQTLPGTSPVDRALEELEHAVRNLASFAGINHLVIPASGMPLCFFMDTPANSLGQDPNDFAVLAWWVLANVSWQFNPQVFHSKTKAADGTETDVLFDTGPHGFRSSIATHEANWPQFCAERLGGHLIGADYLVYALTEPTDLAELALDVMRAVQTYKLEEKAHRTALAHAAAAGGITA